MKTRHPKQECTARLHALCNTDHVLHTELVRHGVVDHELHFTDVALNPLEVCEGEGKRGHEWQKGATLNETSRRY